MPPDKPGSEAAHYHLFQTETVRVRQGKLGYFIGHQSHVQAAEAGAEVVIQPGEHASGRQLAAAQAACCSRWQASCE